jgi:hypothetical protein
MPLVRFLDYGTESTKLSVKRTKDVYKFAFNKKQKTCAHNLYVYII